MAVMRPKEPECPDPRSWLGLEHLRASGSSEQGVCRGWCQKPYPGLGWRIPRTLRIRCRPKVTTMMRRDHESQAPPSTDVCDNTSASSACAGAREMLPVNFL